MSRIKDIPELILLNAGRADHFADWNWKGVDSPFARIYLVREGSAKVIIGEEQHTLTAGNLYIIPPFTTHGYECDEFFSLYYLHVYEKNSAKVRVMEEFRFPFEVPAGPLAESLILRLLEINPARELQRYDPSSYDNSSMLLWSISKDSVVPYHCTMETHGILCQLLSVFLPGAVPKLDISDNRLRRVLSYIRKNIDGQISIRDLSSLCNWSDDHFIRVFRQEVGCSPVKYIHLRKIEKAQLLLTTHDIPVKDLAYSLSFENVSYFIRLFKRITGSTPQQYKERGLSS